MREALKSVSVTKKYATDFGLLHIEFTDGVSFDMDMGTLFQTIYGYYVPHDSSIDVVQKIPLRVMTEPHNPIRHFVYFESLGDVTRPIISRQYLRLVMDIGSNEFELEIRTSDLERNFTFSFERISAHLELSTKFINFVLVNEIKHLQGMYESAGTKIEYEMNDTVARTRIPYKKLAIGPVSTEDIPNSYIVMDMKNNKMVVKFLTQDEEEGICYFYLDNIAFMVIPYIKDALHLEKDSVFAIKKIANSYDYGNSDDLYQTALVQYEVSETRSLVPIKPLIEFRFLEVFDSEGNRNLCVSLTLITKLYPTEQRCMHYIKTVNLNKKIEL